MVACNRTIRQVFCLGRESSRSFFILRDCGRRLLTISPAGVIVKNTVYILREVEAPTGYVKANDTEFKLNDYGIVTKISGDAQLVDDQSFNLYNSKQVKEKIVYKTNVTTVKTGDNTNIVIYVILLFVSLLCIFGFLKKKQIKE